MRWATETSSALRDRVEIALYIVNNYIWFIFEEKKNEEEKIKLCVLTILLMFQRVVILFINMDGVVTTKEIMQ